MLFCSKHSKRSKFRLSSRVCLTILFFFSHLHLVTNIQNQNVKTEQICYNMSFVFKNTYAKINAGYCGDHVGPTTTRQISCFVVTLLPFLLHIQLVTFYTEILKRKAADLQYIFTSETSDKIPKSTFLVKKCRT